LRARKRKRRSPLRGEVEEKLNIEVNAGRTSSVGFLCPGALTRSRCGDLSSACIRSPISDPMIHFDRKFLGVIQNGNTFTMDEWVADYAPAEGDLLLQMDIQGAEYPVLLNASEKALRRFRIIIAELRSQDRLIDPVGFALIASALDRLLEHFPGCPHPSK
jgi:hypothetical protein